MQFLCWLGASLEAAWPEITRWLRRSLAVAGFLALLALLLACALIFPGLIIRTRLTLNLPPQVTTTFTPEQRLKAEEIRLRAEADRVKVENDVRTTLLQGVGGLVLFLGAVVAWRQLHTMREGQITERFTRAIDQLGNTGLAVRLGGIYALERIAKDSATDYGPVVEVLTAFVRMNARRETRQPTEAGKVQRAPVGRTDIQAILTVLGRRNANRQRLRLDLRETDLRDARLAGAHLEGAVFAGAHLEAAELTGAHLEGATFAGAHLEHAILIQAHLTRANLADAHLEGARLAGAHLYQANLADAHLEHASLPGAHLKSADLSRAHLEGATLPFAHLEGALLIRAHLEGTYLKGIHLEGANLSRAHLEGAELTGAHLEGAQLAGANLRGARGLVKEQLALASLDDTTEIEPHLRPPSA